MVAEEKYTRFYTVQRIAPSTAKAEPLFKLWTLQDVQEWVESSAF